MYNDCASKTTILYTFYAQVSAAIPVACTVCCVKRSFYLPLNKDGGGSSDMGNQLQKVQSVFQRLRKVWSARGIGKTTNTRCMPFQDIRLCPAIQL